MSCTLMFVLSQNEGQRSSYKFARGKTLKMSTVSSIHFIHSHVAFKQAPTDLKAHGASAVLHRLHLFMVLFGPVWSVPGFNHPLFSSTRFCD